MKTFWSEVNKTSGSPLPDGDGDSLGVCFKKTLDLLRQGIGRKTKSNIEEHKSIQQNDDQSNITISELISFPLALSDSYVTHILLFGKGCKVTLKQVKRSKVKVMTSYAEEPCLGLWSPPPLAQLIWQIFHTKNALKGEQWPWTNAQILRSRSN